MNRHLKSFLALVLMLSCFAGCNQTPTETQPSTQPTEPAKQLNEISDVAEFEAQRSFFFFIDSTPLLFSIL